MQYTCLMVLSYQQTVRGGSANQAEWPLEDMAINSITTEGTGSYTDAESRQWPRLPSDLAESLENGSMPSSTLGSSAAPGSSLPCLHRCICTAFPRKQTLKTVPVCSNKRMLAHGINRFLSKLYMKFVSPATIELHWKVWNLTRLFSGNCSD